MSDGDRHIRYDFTYMWILKKKRKQMKKQNKTEQISDYLRGRGLGEGEIREGSQMYGDG